jgi:predicted transcriptional regulator
LGGSQADGARRQGLGEAERQRRLIWEAKMIAKADADIAAGRLIDETDIDTWIDSVGTDQELPAPRSRR